jgi:hypothetical protein
MDVCLRFLCVVLSCVGRGLASGRPPVDGVLTNCPIALQVSQNKF